MGERWTIPEAMRGVIVKTLAKILIDPESSNREKTAAARALIHADAQNIEMEKIQHADEHEERARLVEIAKHIGFDELAAIASENGIEIASQDERTVLEDRGERLRQDGRISEQEASKTARHQDIPTGESSEET